MFPDLTEKGKVDRPPALVSGAGVTKLLGIPKLPSAPGKVMTEAVLGCLENWGIKHRVQAMSFDTNSSNTGHMIGACTSIELQVGRYLLHLACHHHIMEIIAEKIFSEACNIPSTGPDILIFKRFQQHWEFIDKEQYEVAEHNVANKEDILTFCYIQLTSCHPHDDYRELLELTIIYLGGVPSCGIRFLQPGTHHRARWMDLCHQDLLVSVLLYHDKARRGGNEDICCFCRHSL